MPAIPDAQQEQIKFYLGYVGTTIPWGDGALLARSLARTDYSNDVLTLISGQVTRAQVCWDELHTPTGELAYNRNITGDVNRTDQELRSPSFRQRQKQFIYETDQLALTLGVRNYRNPSHNQYIHYGLPNP
jgi:hypothetical protein